MRLLVTSATACGDEDADGVLLLLVRRPLSRVTAPGNGGQGAADFPYWRVRIDVLNATYKRPLAGVPWCRLVSRAPAAERRVVPR